jgi:hypothetical protein
MNKKFNAVWLAGALLALSMPVFADANCVGNADCIGTQYNSTTTLNSPVGIGIGGSAEANAYSAGVGIGGGAEVDVRNTNTALGGQGGSSVAVGGGADVDNKVTNTNVNGNSNDNRNTSTNVLGQQQGQQQSNSNVGVNGQKQSTNNANNAAQSTSVTVQGDNVNYEAKRIPVSSSYAPANFPTATCMGSTSGGAQGIGFGVSFGTSWKDENCMLLEQVRATASVLGDKDTAAMMMCGVKAYKAVRSEFCDSLNKPKVEAKVETTPLAEAAEPQASARPAAYVGKPAEGNAAQLY